MDPVRTVSAFEVTRDGSMVRMRTAADGFLYNMVRILVGTLVEVGLSQREADSIPELYGKARSEAGMLMPPAGLCLMEVTY